MSTHTPEVAPSLARPTPTARLAGTSMGADPLIVAVVVDATLL